MRKTYVEVLEIVEEAKRRGLTCAIVFKPDYSPSVESGDENVNWPDLIVSSTDDPRQIAALLGNWPLEEDAN